MPRAGTHSSSFLIESGLNPTYADFDDDDDVLEHDPPGEAQQASAPEAAAIITPALGREEFQELITPLVPRLFRLCMALTGVRDHAEDLLQMSLVKAYLHRDSFEGRGSLVGWLMSIVRSEYNDAIRTVVRRRGLVREALERFSEWIEDMRAAPPPDPEAWTCTRQEAGMLLECVHALTEPYRTIVWLCDVEELSYEEIAEMLEIPIGTVKSRHARGRARVRQAIERRRG